MKELSIHYIYSIKNCNVKMIEKLKFGLVKFFIKTRNSGVPQISKI